MLSFLSPLFLAGAAAAAVPIVLHLLKREPEARMKWAAVRLLKRAPVEHTARRHLRELILLALRVAAFVLVARTFARPFFATGAAVASSSVTIVALDTSYSLSAPGRFERARQLAKDAIARAPAGDLVGVVSFADEAEILAKPGADRVLAAAAIDEAAPGFGATRYRRALSAASQNLDGRRGTIVVVTDLQENGWDAGDHASVPAGTTIQLADVGALPPNLAVTAVRTLADRVVATIHNGGARPRDARVHLTIDGRPAGDAIVSLGPNQSADATFAGAPRGSSAAVAVDDPGGIQADNVRYAVLGGTSRPSVLVVTGSGDLGREAFYVPRALAPGDVRHPVFQAFAGSSATFGLVTFQNAARIGGSACQTLARFTTGDTALIECPAGEGRALVLASDLDNRWSDFPLHATFVPFLHEVVRYLASARAHASDYVIADVPPGVKRVPGVVMVTGAGRAGNGPRPIAVTVDPRHTA